MSEALQYFLLSVAIATVLAGISVYASVWPERFKSRWVRATNVGQRVLLVLRSAVAPFALFNVAVPIVAMPCMWAMLYYDEVLRRPTLDPADLVGAAGILIVAGTLQFALTALLGVATFRVLDWAGSTGTWKDQPTAELERQRVGRRIFMGVVVPIPTWAIRNVLVAVLVASPAIIEAMSSGEDPPQRGLAALLLSAFIVLCYTTWLRESLLRSDTAQKSRGEDSILAES